MLKMNALCADSVRPPLCELLPAVITCVVTLGMGILYDEPESHDKLLRESQANFLMHCQHFLTYLCESLHTTSSSICAFGANLECEAKL